jgi:hypothetical protein
MHDLEIALPDGQVPQPWKLRDNRGHNMYMFLVRTCQRALTLDKDSLIYLRKVRAMFW